MTSLRKERRMKREQSATPNESSRVEEEIDHGSIRERWKTVRKIPIYVRVLVVLLLVLLAIVFGAMFGYSVLGDGRAFDVFKVETWRHIFDIYKGVQS